MNTVVNDRMGTMHLSARTDDVIAGAHSAIAITFQLTPFVCIAMQR